MIAPQSVMSPLDMLEINGQSFMNAVIEMRRVKVLIEGNGEAPGWKNDPIPADTRPIALGHIDEMVVAVQQLHARAAYISADRLRDNLENNETFTWNQLRDAMADIELRLSDELSLVKLFVLNPAQSVYLLPGPDLMGQQVADRFPSLLFEMEEAAKCLALARPTASAFHSMRALEIAIRAMAKFLGIADPTRPAERNWGFVLKTIKAAIDAKYPSNTRMPNSEGSALEALFQSLDAIKNPWRNATMHAENVYQPHEADHILQCVNVFLLNLSALCDEDGAAP